jgi:hypothetical protein
MVERIAQKLLDKGANAIFNANWFAIVVKEAKNKFDKNFTTGKKAHHPLLYKGVNLGYGTKTQREVIARGVVQMKVKGHVATRV